MRGSAVSTPVVVVSGDACACVQALVPGRQPHQRQLSVGGVRAVVVEVRAMSAVCVCLCVGGERCACAVCGAHLLQCVRALYLRCCVSACGGAWCVSCVAVTRVHRVCEPWCAASAVAAVVSVRGRNSSMRGSTVSTPALVVSGDATACVQVVGPVQQPDHFRQLSCQLSVGGVRAAVVIVRAVCALCVC
jgi:hypothetical protein